MPLRECNRRRRNEYPWPALRGATPRFTAGEVGLEAVATKSLAQLGMKSELIIILATQKGSQISGRIVFLVEIGVACKGKWPHAAPGSYRRESHCVNQSRNLRKASPRWL